MEAITIQAAPREAGKKAARRARREGNVPCVLYGRHAEPVAFEVPELSLKPLIYTSELHVVHIEVGEQAWDCVMKAVDFHPVTDRPIHADFMVLQRGEALTLTVPVQFHGTPIGQKEGGDTQKLVHELQIHCLPKDIPSHLDVEIGHLAIGDSIHVRDLDLPGITIAESPDKTVVSVVPPRGGLGTEEEGVETGALGLTEPGEEGESADEIADEEL